MGRDGGGTGAKCMGGRVGSRRSGWGGGGGGGGRRMRNGKKERGRLAIPPPGNAGSATAPHRPHADKLITH